MHHIFHLALLQKKTQNFALPTLYDKKTLYINKREMGKKGPSLEVRRLTPHFDPLFSSHTSFHNVTTLSGDTEMKGPGQRSGCVLLSPSSWPERHSCDIQHHTHIYWKWDHQREREQEREEEVEKEEDKKNPKSNHYPGSRIDKR